MCTRQGPADCSKPHLPILQRHGLDSLAAVELRNRLSRCPSFLETSIPVDSAPAGRCVCLACQPRPRLSCFAFLLSLHQKHPESPDDSRRELLKQGAVGSMESGSGRSEKTQCSQDGVRLPNGVHPRILSEVSHGRLPRGNVKSLVFSHFGSFRVAQTIQLYTVHSQHLLGESSQLRSLRKEP